MPKKILMPLPDRDFDVTEGSVPWRLFPPAGHEVVFATERGEKPAGDPLLLDGVIFGQLGAEPEPKRFYLELEQAPAFAKPSAWRDIDPGAFDLLYLAGGHAKAMSLYLEGE